MDIKKTILKYLNARGEVKIADIVRKTGFSRAYIHRFFKELQNEGRVILTGKTNQARYILAKQKKFLKKPLVFQRSLPNKNLSEDLILEDIKKETDIFYKLRPNIIDILDYSFSEMLNNAIEHSKSKKILVQMQKTGSGIKFMVADSGVGIYNDIKKKFKLKNTIEAIDLLLKGKQTTAPKTHTGEGIFFTSKIADEMIIKSSGKKLIFDNKIKDIFIRDIKKAKGTKVVFEISKFSKKNLLVIFKEYADADFGFNKTKIIVKLLKLGGQSYISRSQARRLVFGLEKFQRVVLDFKDVETIGQAFADEVFRIWREKYPQIKIKFINYNKNVEFMIKRAGQ